MQIKVCSGLSHQIVVAIVEAVKRDHPDAVTGDVVYTETEGKPVMYHTYHVRCVTLVERPGGTFDLLIDL